jgi:hypothetical protein
MDLQDDEEEQSDMHMPFFSHLSFFSHLAQMRANEDDEIENQMIQSAMDESMESLHQSLFRKDSRLQLNLIAVQATTEQDHCHICLESILPAQEIICLQCEHVFHALCIQTIVSHRHNKCPICRKEIPVREKTPSLQEM